LVPQSGRADGSSLFQATIEVVGRDQLYGATGEPAGERAIRPWTRRL